MKLQATSRKLKPTHGFTLVEIMVAVSIFAIVAVITTGALVTASNVNRKAQAIKMAIDNLNFAIDSMTLNLQSGGYYHCLRNLSLGSLWISPSYDVPLPCTGYSNPTESQGVAFRFGYCPSGPSGCEQVIYRYNASTESLEVWRETWTSFVGITAPEISIDSFRVYVFENPYRTLLAIGGKVNDNTNTAFNLETTIYARN